MILTKQQILSGKDYREEVYIPSLKGSVTLRPLTQSEYALIETTIAKATNVQITPGKGNQKTNTTVDLDIQEVVRQEHETDCIAVQLGLVLDEPFTIAEIKGISPAGAISEIAKEVYRISGVSPSSKGQVGNFREDEGGPQASETD